MATVRLKLILPPAGALAALALGPAYAHGFGERYDLPIPLSFFAAGGAATVAVSFILIGAVMKGEAGSFDYPRFNLLRYSWIRAGFSEPFPLIIKLIAVFLFLLVIATGIFGSARPVNNFAPTFVWIIFGVGMGFFTGLVGNLWALVNPWKILYTWAESLYQLARPGEALTLGREYPRKWGVWPAALLFLAFSWGENAFSASADPRWLATMALTYSVVTLGGMFVFGKNRWLRHGEAFSVMFSFFSRFSITEARVTDPEVCRECSLECRGEGGQCIDCYECFEHAEDREFNLRPPAVGLNNDGIVTNDIMAMVMLLLATVTFDGFSATPEWLEVQSYFITQFPGLTSPFLNGVTIANTLGLIGFPLTFAIFYSLFSYLMHRAVGRHTRTITMAQAFVFSLMPIALAYNYAHFLSFLLIQGQQIFPLASDPFGVGWNLFRTADYLIEIRVTSARFIWFFSIATIVLGHVIAVYLAHVRAMRLYPDRTLALRSQLPMLGLMVVYTMVSLWIISRPIIN